ncbi:hypothetical protein SGL43_05675 [Streptomyces globisporus]|uniref:Uncharacterized protein n=1 Tax=Streptomyces globisporus TaxID=1908 RepID=A0ABM9H4Q6_STRGL|nr:hypothetical protein SGL43_05675 [Streptomyces globisporus]
MTAPDVSETRQDQAKLGHPGWMFGVRPSTRPSGGPVDGRTPHSEKP